MEPPPISSIIEYHKLPELLLTLITLLISSLLGSLLSGGGRYFLGAVTFGGSLLSGSRYFRGVVTFWKPLLSEGRYFLWAVTFGGRYFRGGRRVVTFWRPLFSEGRYFRGVGTFGKQKTSLTHNVLRSSLNLSCCHMGGLFKCIPCKASQIL